MIRRPPRSTLSSSSAASDVYKRQILGRLVRALSFVLPAIGFLFLLRFLNLPLTPALGALLALPLVRTFLPFFLPAASPLVGGLSVLSVGLVSIGFLIVFR